MAGAEWGGLSCMSPLAREGPLASRDGHGSRIVRRMLQSTSEMSRKTMELGRRINQYATFIAQTAEIDYTRWLAGHAIAAV